MKTLALILALSATLFAGETIRPGSKVYVTPTKDDFYRYLMAEIQKQDFPIVLVTKREEAEYEIAVTSSLSKSSDSQYSIFPNGNTNDDETLSIINLKTGVIIFTETVYNRNAKRGYKSAAEICAKHLRMHIKKH